MMVRTEVDLKTAKRWIIARNLMVTVVDPQSVDMRDPDIASEMIVESARVIDQVTELAEKWQELALKPFDVDTRIAQWIIQVTKVKTGLRMMLSMFKSAEAIRRGEKDPLLWILEDVQESKMEEWWKETMTLKNLRLIEKESVSKPQAKPVRKAWEEYKEAQMESQLVRQQLHEDARNRGASTEEIYLREQGALLREIRLRQAEKQAKLPLQAPRPVPEEKEDEMEEDKEEPEEEE